MTNLFRAEQRSAAFSIATLLNIGITVPLTVILVVVYKEGPLGIIVGNLSGTLVVFLALLGYRREQLGLQFDRNLLHRMNRFGIPLMAAALATWVMNFGDRLMLAKLLHGTYALTSSGSTRSPSRSARRWFSSSPPSRSPGPRSRIRSRTRTKRRAPIPTPYVPDVHRRLGGGRPEPVCAVDRPSAREPTGLLAGLGGDPALAYSSVFFAGFIVVTIATGRARRTKFNWVADRRSRRSQLRAEPLAIPAYGMLGAAYATLAATS